LSTGEQSSLFSTAELAGCYRTQPPQTLAINRETLQLWKQRIRDYQQQIVLQANPAQGSLFDAIAVTPPHEVDEVDHLDPFSLPRQNTDFWRWKATDAGLAALYFVIDYEEPILLYVGETVKSGQRWKGEHDCKRYLVNYRQAHYDNQLSSQLGIAFWTKAPTETRSRQQLESALIAKWRSPFNKENWVFWGTPFTGGK
jgi:hypothetical protein